MPDVAPQTRAAGVVWHLLLRHWSKLGGLRTVDVSRQFGVSWEGAWSFMKRLSEVGCTLLPVFQRRDLDTMPWVCNYWPNDLAPVAGVNPAQKAAILTHRIVTRQVLFGKSEWGRQKVSKLLAISPAIATQLLNRIASHGGIPMHSSNGVWVLDTSRFSEVALPYRHDIPQGGCDTLYA